MCTLCSATQTFDPARHTDAEGVAGATVLNSSQPTGTLDELATFLYQGAWEVDGDSQRSYDLSSSNQITVNITGLTAEGKQLARWAFEAWELVEDMTFVESTSSVVMMTFDDEDSGAYAYSITQGQTIQSSTVNVDTDWIDTYGSTISSYSCSTYVHEIGHALGLGHQVAYNGQATYGVDETYANDSYQISVMSYFSQTDNTTINASYAEPITAMMADIVAIQTLYGAPGDSSQTAGNTTWGVGTNLTGYMAEVFNQTSNLGYEPVTYTIYDLSGRDVLDYSNNTTDDRLDLQGESYSDIGGLVGNIAIARDTVIEEANMGSGNDTVTGNSADNSIRSGAGNDEVSAGEGNDTIIAGEGNDSIEGGAGNDQIWAGSGDLGNDEMNGGAGDDVMGGGAGDDTINGDDGDDTVFGGAGDDNLNGMEGLDVIWAGGGIDVVDGGTQNDILGGGDGSDTLQGGAGNDQIFAGVDGSSDQVSGEAGNDTLFGGSGDDTLTGGVGDDEIFGGGDNDVIVFAAGHGDDSVGGFESLGDNTLDLSAIGLTGMGDLNISQSGSDVLIDTTEGTITLWNTEVSDITASDFIF